MPVQINIDLSGLSSVEGFLEKSKSVISDLNPELILITEYMKNFIENDVFLSEGAAYGDPWAALSPSTITEKEKKYGSKGPLIASGAMKAGFRVQGGLGVAQIFNTQDYLLYHQTGTRKMPQRIVMNIDQERAQRITEIVNESVIKRIVL